jgi:hypothetical protein
MRKFRDLITYATRVGVAATFVRNAPKSTPRTAQLVLVAGAAQVAAQVAAVMAAVAALAVAAVAEMSALAWLASLKGPAMGRAEVLLSAVLVLVLLLVPVPVLVLVAAVGQTLLVVLAVVPGLGTRYPALTFPWGHLRALPGT